MPVVSPLDVSASLWLPFLGVVVFGLAYLLLFAGLAHVGQRPPPPGRRPFFVFVVPCLNEELVIGRCLDKLLALPSTDFAILVVDDGSDDGTAAVAGGYDPGTNTVYWGTANPAPLYDWGGAEWKTKGARPGDNLYVASTIAIDSSRKPA